MVSRIGILVVTHNAHSRLELVLESLRDIGISEVIVADSSDAPYLSISDKSITYYHCPGLSLIEKIYTYAGKINSEFIFLHPDGEFVNPYAFIYINQMLNFESKNISSTLAQNLTFSKSGNKILIKPRNYRFFTGHAHYCMNPDAHIENCLSPYHQLVWGIHEVSAFKKFFAVAVKIPWENDSWMHACLFERLFNVFMHLSGRVIVSTLPLLLRCEDQSSDRSTLSIQSANAWLNAFEQGSDKHKIFIESIAMHCEGEFGMDAGQFKAMFLKMLRNEYVLRDLWLKTPSLMARFQKKLRNFFRASIENNFHFKDESLGVDEIYVESGLMTKGEFDMFLSTAIPFLALRSEVLRKFRSTTTNS